MPDQGFQLTTDDVEILHCVYGLRIAQIDHLAALTARSQKALARRLLKLTQRRFLACITRRPQKHVYAVGSAAIPVLIENGYARQDLAAKRLRHGELKEIFLRHFLFVVDIHVRLLQLTKQGVVELADWREGSELWDQVTVADIGGRGETLPIRPDAAFTLRDKRQISKNRFHFFLEADRSTMSHSRMSQKVTGYVNYFQKGLFRSKYPGMKSFTVATVTESRARATALADDLSAIIPQASRKAYPFVAFQDLSIDALAPMLSGGTRTADWRS